MAGVFKEFAQQWVLGCSGIVSSEDVTATFFFEYFVASGSYIASWSYGPFRTLFSRHISIQVVTFFDLSERQVSLTSQTLFVPQCQLHIRYWKQSVLGYSLCD